MTRYFSRFIIASLLSIIVSCGAKDTKSSDSPVDKDTAGVKNPQPANGAADTTLESARPLIEKGLDAWMRSFAGFSIDSFHLGQKSAFGDEDYSVDDMGKFYDLYKGSLVYSPDSSQFIDLYSYGLMLEKVGKKIIASADADNSVTLHDLKTKSWKRISSFGPSAWIEEAIWLSPSTFILAGVMHNDEGQQQAFLLLGNSNERYYRWFESKLVRAQSVKYEASGMTKLKIDEWE